MVYELMREEDYYSLPQDDDLRFAAIESLCRRRMAEITSQSRSEVYDEQIRREYVATILGAAKSVGLDDQIKFAHNFDEFGENFDEFIMTVVAKTTEIRTKKSTNQTENSVTLANRTKSFIEIEISKLKSAISSSDLPVYKIEQLLNKLEEVRSELHRGRLDIKKVAYLLSCVGMFGVHSIVVASVYPEAMTNIMRLIGLDKEAEEKETLRISGVPQVEALSSSPKRINSTSVNDDEIPF